MCLVCRSQWPRCLRRRSAAARLLRLWVRISPGVRMFVCCECCVLSGRGLCDGLITHPEESYRLWRVVVCDQETSKTRRLKPATGLWKYNQKGCNARKTNKQFVPCVCGVKADGLQSDFKPLFIFPGTQFWSVTIPKYLNFAAFWKDLLVICIRWSSV